MRSVILPYTDGKILVAMSVRGGDRQPPVKSSVRLRLEGASYNIPREGLRNLASNRMTSTLNFSELELRGLVKRAVASSAYFGGPAEFLRQEFAALSEGERRTFKEFVRWLEEYRPSEFKTSWDPASSAEIVAAKR